VTPLDRPILVLVSGLPASGKSTLAAGVADRLSCAHVSIDTVEAAMWRSGIKRSHNSGVAAYEVTAAVAAQQIAAGRDAVVDAVNDSTAARDTWPPVAAAHPNGRLLVLFTRIDDERVHRERVEGRKPLPGFYIPTWSDVVERARRYPEWPGVTVVDTGEPYSVTLATAMAAVEATRLNEHVRAASW
jgi:predicted kinase